MKISFILGAGFSFNAGLPMAKDIWDRLIDSTLEERTLCFGSSEWKWADLTSGPDLTNGMADPTRIPISLFLKNTISFFLQTTQSEEHNYEAFYAWIISQDEEGSNWNIIKTNTKSEIKAKHPENEDYFNTHLSKGRLIFCLIHLIDDLLWPRKHILEYKLFYTKYLNLLKDTSNIVRIYTLNHDRIIEELLNHNQLYFSDGFSIENSQLIDPYGNRVMTFSNSFPGRIHLYKLHGSIDQHKYFYSPETDRSGEFDYFKTLDYNTKHAAKYLDKHRTIKQNYTWRIEPQFITGRNKLGLIQNDYMYSALYSSFEINLPDSDLLIINGYSFMDPHVEEVLLRSKNSIKKIININPGASFPYMHDNVININPLQDSIILT